MKALSATPSHKRLCGHSETTKDLYRVAHFDSRQSNGTEGGEDISSFVTIREDKDENSHNDVERKGFASI